MIKDFLDKDVFISSSQIVVDKVKTNEDIKVTKTFVKDQMLALDLKYKKVKHIPMQSNSAKSLVLR